MATKVKLVADGVITPDQITLTTASTGTNTTAPATTAFVQQEITALVDSSPAALNTLNELAAALGDDPNFATTVNNNIATKLPLAGGTMTGDIFINGGSTTERSLRIQNTGNVLYVGVEGSSGNRFIDSSTNNAFLGTTSSSGLEFGTANTVRAVIDSSGRVGIGTTSPDSTLHLKSTGDTRMTIESPDANDAYINFSGATNEMSLGFDKSDSAMYITNHGTLTTNRLVTIKTNGNVGIGTTDPNQNGGTGTFTWANPLQTIAGTRPTLFLNSSNVIATIRMWPRATDGTSTSVDDWHINAINQGSGGYLSFAPQGGAIAPKGLHIKNNGNVGINNINPSHELDVHGANGTIIASLDHTGFESRQVGLPGRFMVGPFGNGYPWAGYNFSHVGGTQTRISGDTAWAISYGNSDKLSFNGAANSSAGSALSWTELGYFDINGKFSPRQQIEVGVFSNSQTNIGEAWIGRASDRQDGTFTIQLGGDSATGTSFEIVDRAWTKVISYISGEAPGESLFVNSSGDLHFGGNNQGRIKTNSNSVYIDAIPASSHIIFRNNGSVEKMHITDTGSLYHPEQGSDGDYTSYIGSVSNQNNGARYMHVNISTAYGDMFWIEVKGYDYGGGLIDGRSGGYIYNTAVQTNVYSGFQSGDIFTQYQLTNGTLEVVIDTGQGGTVNRWGSMVLRGGTDTITATQPLEIIQYSYTGSTSKVY